MFDEFYCPVVGKGPDLLRW